VEIPVPAARARRRWRRWLVLILALVGLAAAADVAISTAAVLQLTKPHRAWAPKKTPADLGAPYRDVRFPARGGDVEIAGWFAAGASRARAVVLVHGKDASRAREFHGHFVELAAALHARGFDALMIDLRGHGQSGEARFSFGLNEQRDVLGAVDFLRAEGVAPGHIGVLGVSMGAASAIFAAAAEPAIGALVEDSGFSAIAPVVAHEWRKASGLPDFILPSTLFMGRILLGWDIEAARPVDVIGRIAPRPVLLVHGAADTLVPVEHARELHRALPSAEYWELPGVDHAGCYEHDPAAYTERVAAFFERSL
jgi:fermentation-respiration switch protein FrsA (DUF1100 family)